MPKSSNMAKGPRTRESTRRGWRRTSFISLPTNAPALMKRLTSAFTFGSFARDFSVPVHELDEYLIEAGLVLCNSADRAVVGTHGVYERGHSAARILHIHSHSCARV